MNKSKFSPEQIEILLSNNNVDKCSDKSITYSKEFKVKAVKQYDKEGKTSTQIFKEAGFDLDVLGTDVVKGCLIRWRKIYKTEGVKGLKTEARGKGGGGGRPKEKWKTDEEKIKYLEAKVEYLKAENDFLAKLRAKKAE